MDAILQQRPKRHGLGQCPVHNSVVHHFHARFEDSLDARVGLEVSWGCGTEGSSDVLQDAFFHAGGVTFVGALLTKEVFKENKMHVVDILDNVNSTFLK